MKVAVQVFARPPIPGACKRRLIPALGAEGAAALHARMVTETMGAAQASGADRVELWQAPERPVGRAQAAARDRRSESAKDLFLVAAAGRVGAVVHHQAGAGLGERMAHAMDDAEARGYASVLIGTDCPALDAGRIAVAVARLRAGVACVLRPTLDGGYVCVGALGAPRALFDNMPWGTAEVMARSRERLKAEGIDWVELACVADVDRPEDLVHVPSDWLVRRG